ncbi:hypothetical protein TNCV_4385511 [Trichonephila clavipes]|nr:hypothetical protein TNCV_4385511 [Trichonephila clavipes]
MKCKLDGTTPPVFNIFVSKWFHHVNGAPPHWSEKKFPERDGKKEEIQYPGHPYLQMLIPLDFFLCGYVKTIVYHCGVVSKDKNWAIFNKDTSWVPRAPRKAALAHFRLLTGHYCLRSHLYRIGIADSPDCTLFDSGQPMTAEHLVVCLALIIR